MIEIQNTSLINRAEEPVKFLAASAPDFFPNGSGSRFVSQASPIPGIFFQATPAPRGQKHAAPCGSGSWLLVKFGEIFPPLPPTNYWCRTARKIITVFFTIKTCYFTLRRVTNVHFYLLGAAYFWRLQSPIFFVERLRHLFFLLQAAPAPRGLKHLAPSGSSALLINVANYKWMECFFQCI